METRELVFLTVVEIVCGIWFAIAGNLMKANGKMKKFVASTLFAIGWFTLANQTLGFWAAEGLGYTDVSDQVKIILFVAGLLLAAIEVIFIQLTDRVPKKEE